MSGCGLGAQVLCLSNIEGLLDIDVTGITATIDVKIIGGGCYWYKIWLSDSADDPTPTLVKPTSGSTVIWEGVTNDDGEVTIQFERNATEHTYYAWAIFQIVNKSSAITVGT